MIPNVAANNACIDAIRRGVRLWFAVVSVEKETITELTFREEVPPFKRDKVRGYFTYDLVERFYVEGRAHGKATHFAYWEPGAQKPLAVMSAHFGDDRMKPGRFIEPIINFRIEASRFLLLEDAAA